MMLVLGVIDIPYAEEAVKKKKIAKAKTGKSARPLAPKVAVQTETTGEVAESLEARYHIMEKFAERRKAFIEKEIQKSLHGEIVNLGLGAPVSNNPFHEAMNGLQQEFRTFLDTEEMATTGVPGVPTLAAKMGVNHRLKLERGPRRPSFIDTGLYQQAFKAWVE